MNNAHFWKAAFLTAVLLPAQAFADNSFLKRIEADPDASAGIYMVYPDTAGPLSPVPEGFEPVYISHYGRHGSRWMIKESNYTSLLNVMNKADSLGVLTATGERIRDKIARATAQAAGMEGSLSPLGAAQHKGIARRMAAEYPALFNEKRYIDARSTNVPRCIISMASFCEGLKEVYPALRIDKEASDKSTLELNFIQGSANKICREYKDYCENGLFLDEFWNTIDRKCKPETTYSKLFRKDMFGSKKASTKYFYSLYNLATSLKNVMPEESVYEIFTPEQLYWMAVADSRRCYSKRGPDPANGGWPVHYAKRLLKDFVVRADSALVKGDRAADLRFGHDICLMSFIPLMHLNTSHILSDDPEETILTWNVADLTPMAANVQLVFFNRKDGKPDDAIVRILLNEKEAKIPVPECAPGFYRWTDVRNFFLKLIDTPKEKLFTESI